MSDIEYKIHHYKMMKRCIERAHMLVFARTHRDREHRPRGHHPETALCNTLLSLGTTRHSGECVARWLEEGDGKSYKDGLRHHSLFLLVSELYQLWMGYESGKKMSKSLEYSEIPK